MMEPLPGRVSLVAVSVLLCALLLLAARPAAASHSANGSGGCNGHTTTCYPECRWEWTGAQVGTPADAGPCTMPADTRETNNPTSINVGNFPATQPVSGSVTVAGTVTADKGAGWPTGDPNTPASEVRVINASDDPIPFQPNNTTRQALAVLVLLTVGYFVFKIGRS